MAMQRLTVNLSGKVRHDSMEGRDFLVAPMVMITAGVHNGSQGSLYYPDEELAKNPGVWNHKPIVVYHPQRGGAQVSACDPDILSNRKVGVVMNNRHTDGKWKAEAWLEPSRLKEVDDRILDALESDTMMELSTGLYVEHEKEKGEFEGTPYEAIARNYMPDHLAILPDKVGACSIEDGAGLLRNELSQNGVYVQLSDRIQERFGSTDKMAFVEEVFSNYAIYDVDNTLWKITYTKKKDVVELGSTPIRVTRKVLYTTLKGDVLDNGSYPFNYLTEKEPIMAKKKDELVDALIKNETSVWKEDDRELLSGFGEERLEALNKPAVVKNSKSEKTDVQKAAEKGAEELAPVLKSVENVKPTKPITAEEYIANAPPEVREVLSEGISTSREQKKSLIDAIVGNEKNIFTAEHLNTKSISELRGIYALAGEKKEENLAPSFAGAIGASPFPVANAEDQKPLELSTLSFD